MITVIKNIKRAKYTDRFDDMEGKSVLVQDVVKRGDMFVWFDKEDNIGWRVHGRLAARNELGPPGGFYGSIIMIF